jgi:hypothetical protein
MKRTEFATLVVALLAWHGAARSQDVGTVRFHDAAWSREAAGSLARCSGTYQGAARVMRQGGRDQDAAYLEQVATGAFFAAYVLLTPGSAPRGETLDTRYTKVYLEGLARSSEQRFGAIASGPSSDRALSEALRTCTRMSMLQSSVLRTLSAPKTAEAEAAN